MKLSIYSIEKTLFEGDVEKIIARTPEGEITVLNHHIPLISIVLGPEFRLVDKENNIHTIKIVSGFLEVRPDGHVVVLFDTKTS